MEKEETKCNVIRYLFSKENAASHKSPKANHKQYDNVSKKCHFIIKQDTIIYTINEFLPTSYISLEHLFLGKRSPKN